MERHAVVIGAGIVGCAVARDLKMRYPDWEMTILERNKSVFSETSRYNSGVVHSGIHQEPHLLKSELARRGSKLLIEFCAEKRVPFEKAGMIIVAAASDLPSLMGEFRSLTLLRRNSRTQGIPIKFLSGRGIRKLEPEVRGAFGIHIPDVWVVDQKMLATELSAQLFLSGVRFTFGTPVRAIRVCGEKYEVVTDSGVYPADVVVNAAGVSADLVAALAGFDGPEISPWRGEYYEIVGEKAKLVKSSLVYPVLPPGHPVKGIHLTKTVDGRLLLGPNATSWKHREDNFEVRTPPDEFLACGRKFLPSLELEDLRWAYSGLRAKIGAGKEEKDFVIRWERIHPLFVNLLGIESPGFTSAFAIAEHVRGIVESFYAA